ncbi:vacuolar-sorting protein SNF8-like [Bolinopsis microptera]|uniref:vacuolar-sorting protein SNF8-like n=1 Tax=Bolinopsis microptera TaxID=2820187 RepID=UPI003078FD08
MRRNVGIGAIRKQRLAQEKLTQKGNEIAELQVQQVSQQMDVFKKSLEEFAMKYKNEIKKNPEFRARFQVMCSKIGVDPLASSKGFWAQLLGVGDFYYELGVQIVEVCLATRPINGGIITMEDLVARLGKSSGKTRKDVQPDDVSRAIGKLAVLGDGFKIVKAGKQSLVQSVPGELTMDHTTALDVASQSGGSLTISSLEKMGWPELRINQTIDSLMDQGMIWIDEVDSSYWVPALFH